MIEGDVVMLVLQREVPDVNTQLGVWQRGCVQVGLIIVGGQPMIFFMVAVAGKGLMLWFWLRNIHLISVDTVLKVMLISSLVAHINSDCGSTC